MNQPNFSMQTRTAWSCASWPLTTRTTWRCRSTSPCCSPSAATVASPSCGSRESGGSSSCWEPRMPTETRKSSETSTACWLRTPRPITAGYRRWGPTARRADAWTSGCPSWSCRSAEGGPAPTCMNRKKTKQTGAFWVQILMNRRCSCGGSPGEDWTGLDWAEPGRPDWRPAGTKGLSDLRLTRRSGDWFTKSALCKRHKTENQIPTVSNKNNNQIQASVLRFRSGVTINQRSVTRNAPTPQPGIPV